MKPNLLPHYSPITPSQSQRVLVLPPLRGLYRCQVASMSNMVTTQWAHGEERKPAGVKSGRKFSSEKKRLIRIRIQSGSMKVFEEKRQVTFDL